MGLLSNLLGFRHDRGGGGDDPAAPLVIRQARGEDLEPAMRLILAPPGGGVADARSVNDFIAYSRERGVLFDGLHVALRHDKVAAALLPVVSPGRTVLLLAPGGGRSKATESATRALVGPVCDHCAARGVHLAQTLVDPADAALERIFTDEGFARMAELYYLQAQPPAGAAPPDLPPGMNWMTYSPESHAAFGRAILDSYEQSLDCPALNGRRGIEDVIAGHQASGAFDADNWFLLCEGARPLGVLLLSQSLRSDALELVYLGLSPAARGRKLGELMMRQALAVVARRKLARLCLAVDALNAPALKLYYRHGMQRVGSKLALLRDIGAGRIIPADSAGNDSDAR